MQKKKRKVKNCPFCKGPGFTADNHTARCTSGETEKTIKCAGAFVRVPIVSWNKREKQWKMKAKVSRMRKALGFKEENSI